MHLLDTDTLTHLHAGNARVVENLERVTDSEVATTVVTQIEALRVTCVKEPAPARWNPHIWGQTPIRVPARPMLARFALGFRPALRYAGTRFSSFSGRPTSSAEPNPEVFPEVSGRAGVRS